MFFRDLRDAKSQLPFGGWLFKLEIIFWVVHLDGKCAAA